MKLCYQCGNYSTLCMLPWLVNHQYYLYQSKFITLKQKGMKKMIEMK